LPWIPKHARFPDAMKEFIKIRDVHCRTPYCDGIIENVDHVMQHYLGGPTNVKMPTVDANGAI
jgi:hypothetical protein